MNCSSSRNYINLAEREVTTRNETGVCAANRASRQPCKGAALHLARWMRSHPGSGPLEPEPEIWSTEQLRKRSRELRLIDIANLAEVKSPQNTIPAPAHIEKSPSEQSPSRSTNSDSQITVRSSPVVPETVAVCRQCHKRCFSKPGSPQISAKTPIAEEKPNSSSSPVNNSLLHSTYSCQKKSPVEELKQCINNCANNNCVVENKVKDVSPERNKSQNTSDVETERKSPSIAIRKSREEFFKMTTPKEPCSSPFDRSFKSPSPRSPCSQRSDSSRSTHFSTNSPLSYAHTTCSSMALSTSTGKKSQSPGRDSNASGSSGREEIVQCVIAQEKYLNEVKCVENIMLSKNCGYRNKLKDFGKLYQDTSKSGDDKKFSASMTGKQCLVGDSIGYTDRVNSSFTTSHADFFSGAVKTTVNGHLNIDDDRDSLSGKNTSDMSWGPLMLMGLSAMNPAAHLLALDRRPVSARGSPYHSTASNTTTTTLGSSQVPNIAVVPPTPDYKSDSHILTTQHTLEESPDDSPLAEEPPYLALKRYGTMSSLERLPSDEIDDATIEVETVEKDVDTSQGLLGWTARAGSYVAEKMALLNSLAESGVASTGGSFLERYLGAGEWRSVRGVSISGGETEPGEGSGASGEEAWGTPSSGDLSDHAFPDSDHATLSSPTKSSSSCPGDEDTELMMDELLMTPPIAGPSLRPLLPRRRLEPLLEEDGSDATSNSSGDTTSEITTSPTKDQGSTSGVGSGGDERAAAGWGTSPDRTPTNHTAHPPILVSTVLRGSPQLSSGGGSPSSSTLSGDTPLPLLLGSMDPLTPLSTPHSSLPPSPAVLRAALGAAAEAAQNQQDAPTSRLSPRMEMRLALSEGRDILAEQDQLWDQVSGRCGWVRRPMAIAAAPRPCQRPRSLVAHQNTTLSNSVSVHQGGPKVTAMERLALLEARGARRGGRRPRPSARLMGLVRRRASSDSPERRPYSPRRQPPHVSNQGYYKICFVNGFV